MGPDMRINGRYLPMKNDSRAEGYWHGRLAALREVREEIDRSRPFIHGATERSNTLGIIDALIKIEEEP